MYAILAVLHVCINRLTLFLGIRGSWIPTRHPRERNPEIRSRAPED